MKRTLVPLLLLLLASTTIPAGAKPSLSAEAQRDYLAGDYTAAKQKFELILATDPKNVAARNYLKMIATAEGQAKPGAKLESQLQKLILPQVDFKEATLDAALDYLRVQATKVSAGKIQTSFVLQPGVNSSTPVTLHLVNIPFTEVLRYMSELANVQFSVDRYAISVKPKAAKVEQAPAPAATGTDEGTAVAPQ